MTAKSVRKSVPSICAYCTRGTLYSRYTSVFPFLSTRGICTHSTHSFKTHCPRFCNCRAQMHRELVFPRYRSCHYTHSAFIVLAVHCTRCTPMFPCPMLLVTSKAYPASPYQFVYYVPPLFVAAVAVHCTRGTLFLRILLSWFCGS